MIEFCQRCEKLERHRDVLAEPVVTIRVAEEPAVSGCHVAGVEVEHDDLKARVGDRALYRVELVEPRPHELDTGESGRARPGEALGERRVLEQEAEVG